MEGGNSKGRGRSGRVSTDRVSKGPDRSVPARAVLDQVVGPADQDRAAQVRWIPGRPRDPVGSDRENSGRPAATTPRSMIAEMLRVPSGELGSPPTPGREGHRKPEEAPGAGSRPRPEHRPGDFEGRPGGGFRPRPGEATSPRPAKAWVRAPEATRPHPGEDTSPHSGEHPGQHAGRPGGFGGRPGSRRGGLGFGHDQSDRPRQRPARPDLPDRGFVRRRDRTEETAPGAPFDSPPDDPVRAGHRS